MAIQKGTGFTNLNRIMQANKGNQLGSTVAGGIQGQVQGVKTGVKSAQDQFNEEANKNRLDSDENKAKRDTTLGKFNQSNYTPDESKFQVSSGLQSGYDKQKTDLEAKRNTSQTQQTQQVGDINARIAADKASLADAQNRKISYKPWVQGKGMGSKDGYKSDAKKSFDLNQKRDVKGFTSSVDALQNLLNSQSGYGASQEANYADQLSKADSDFTKQSGEEKNKYLTSERERLMSENAPSEQEIQDVSKFRTGTYTGPTGLKDDASLQAKAQQVESLGNSSRSEGGRQDLLRRFVGGDNYTQGQKQLDSTLLGQDASGLRSAARETRGAGNLVSGASEQAANMGKELVGRAKIFGEQTGQQVQDARSPFSDILDKQVAAAQLAETNRATNQSGIQDLLTGTGDQYKGLEGITRTGLGLQQAMNQGYLSQADASQLLGDKGLIARGQAAGLDINQLLGERLSGTAAKNVGRTGVASKSEIARLNALDRMSGKQGTDLEFLDSQGKYSAGKTGFDINSLQDYIAKIEADKMPQGTQGTVQAGTPGYLDQAKNYAAGAASDPASILAAAPIARTAAIGTAGLDVLTGKDNAAQAVQSNVDTGLNTAGAGLQGKNAILEALTKMNVGGASLEGTPAGKQLLSAIQGMSNLENKGLQGASDVANEWTSGVGGLTSTGLKDIASGNVSNLAKNLAGSSGLRSAGKVIGNVGKTVSKALGGGAGKTGGWATSDYNTADAVTGKKTKIREYANKDSQTILNQMRSMTGRSAAMGKGGAEVAKSLNELNSYYRRALANEQGGQDLERTVMSDEKLKKNISYSDSDLQKFMDRIKPAAYDYKDEVKDSPLASKDRELGVMAQDLEKSKLGDEAVQDTDIGKVVDYKNLEPKMLASIAALNKRLKELESK